MISRSPDDRALYEARLKLQRDEQSRLAAAEARGRMQGALIGKIQLLQGLLNEPEQSSDALMSMPEKTLNSLLASLQERLRSRE